MAKARKKASKKSMRARAMVDAEAVAGRHATLTAALRDVRHQAPRRKKRASKTVRRAKAAKQRAKVLASKGPTKFQRFLMRDPEAAARKMGW